MHLFHQIGAMNTIYNSLERNNTDGLESHHIQAICEYVQNHLVPTVACEASRVLLQMVVFAKGGPVTKMIEKIYLCILADSVVEMEEYSILGECLVKLLELYRSCGSETFKGCQLELPFGNVACQPPKFLIAIRSLRSVVDLVNFWNSVTQSLYQDTGMILPLQRQHNAVLSTLVDFSRLLSNIDATAPMVVALCQAIVSIVSHCSSAGSTVFYPGEQYAPAAMPASLIINGLISWVDYALSCTVKMIAQIGQVAGVTVQTYRPAEVKVAMLRQMHRAMDHILAVVATCVQYPLKNDAIAVVEGKKLVQRIFEVLEAVPKQKELSNACIVKLLGFESMCSSKVALQNNCAAAQSSVAPSSSFMVSSSGKSPAPMRSSGLVLQSTATSTSGSPRRAAAAPSNSPTPTASAESMLSNIAAQLVQIAYVLQTAFALDVPPLEVYQRLCVDLLTTHAVLRAFSLHIHRSPDICAGLCDAWCASSSENALVSSSGMPVDGSGEWQRSESLVEPECKAQRFTPVTPVDSAGKTVASSRTLATSDEGVDASLDLVSLARSSSSRVVRELLSLSQLPEPGDGDADDAKDCLAALVQVTTCIILATFVLHFIIILFLFVTKVMIPFEALMTAVLVVPRNTYSTPPTGTLSQKILRRFLRLFGQFIVPSVGTAVDTADRLTASWALLQCASRLSDASSYDNLIRLLPSAVWRILGCALEATRATMVGFAQAAVNSSSYSASRLSTTATSTSSHNLGGATSTANTPRARQSLQTVQEGGSSSSLNAYAGDNANANGDASLDASQLEELLTDVLSLDVNETELPSSRLPVRCMEDSIENYVLVWLKVAALQVPPGMAAIDNSSSAASSSAGADSSVAAGSKRSRAPGQGQMPGQVQLQDADSFDFFADQDSGAEDNSAGGTRKRLKKKSDSFVPVSGANKSVTSRASAFGLLVQNEAFLSAFELHGSAVIVLIRRLSQQDDVSSEVLTTAVEYVTQAVTRYLMDGTTISVALESALTLLFGKFGMSVLLN